MPADFVQTYDSFGATRAGGLPTYRTIVNASLPDSLDTSQTLQQINAANPAPVETDEKPNIIASVNFDATDQDVTLQAVLWVPDGAGGLRCIGVSEPRTIAPTTLLPEAGRFWGKSQAFDSHGCTHYEIRAVAYTAGSGADIKIETWTF